MKITLKDITLKEDTLNDIHNENIDLDKYITYIRENVDSANNIIETKLKSLDEDELYEILSKIFVIELEDEDLFRVLRKKYNKHYVNRLTINTNLVDINLNKYTLEGAATRSVNPPSNGMSLANLRKEINSYDLVILKTKTRKLTERPSNAEKYEDFNYDIYSLESDPEVFDYLKNLLKKDLKNNFTNIMSLCKKYVNELIYQAKYITKLGEEDELLKPISIQYKKAYEANFSKNTVFIESEHKRRY